MGARMFAAVCPPDDVREHLEEFVGPRRTADDRLRWVPDHLWHVTTLFCGAVPARAVEPLIGGLAEVAGREVPFRIRLAGGGAFPDPVAMRQLYLAVQAGASELGRLSRGCRAAASRVGAEPDGTVFVPHLTLARTRQRFDATRWLRIVDAYAGVDFTARELVLFESHLNEGRGNRVRHEVMARLPLGTPSTHWTADGSVAAAG